MTAAIAIQAMERWWSRFTCVVWDRLGGQGRLWTNNAAVRRAGGFEENKRVEGVALGNEPRAADGW
jgi:hypothetical protein